MPRASMVSSTGFGVTYHATPPISPSPHPSFLCRRLPMAYHCVHPTSTDILLTPSAHFCSASISQSFPPISSFSLLFPSASPFFCLSLSWASSLPSSRLSSTSAHTTRSNGSSPSVAFSVRDVLQMSSTLSTLLPSSRSTPTNVARSPKRLAIRARQLRSLRSETNERDPTWSTRGGLLPVSVARRSSSNSTSRVTLVPTTRNSPLCEEGEAPPACVIPAPRRCACAAARAHRVPWPVRCRRCATVR